MSIECDPLYQEPTLDRLIDRYPDAPWNFSGIMCPSRRTLLKYHNRLWDWTHISRYVDLDMAFVLDNIHLPWRFDYLSANPNITMRDINDNPEIAWRWEHVAFNTGIGLDDKLTRPEVAEYAGNHFATHAEILAHPEINWDYCWQSYSQIPLDYVLDNLEKPWVWWILSNNLILDVEIVTSHQTLPWVWCTLSTNSSITVRSMLEHPDLPWEWRSASHNTSITLADITGNPDRGWNWSSLTSNAAITLDDIHDNLDLPWNMSSIWSNPNITYEYAVKHSERANIKRLSRNRFEQHPVVRRRLIAERDAHYSQLALIQRVLGDLFVGGCGKFSHGEPLLVYV